jgi:trimethylamine--corrinoid protein Co-methyltransferase
VTNSKTLDEQAILEAALTLQRAVITGGNMIHDLGYMESGISGSLELLVICDEMISWIAASTKGLEINEDTLALDYIHKHALCGTFLESDHTLKHVRQEWEPGLIDRQDYATWLENGATSMRQRAKAKIENVLHAELHTFLPKEAEKKIRAIATQAANK